MYLKIAEVTLVLNPARRTADDLPAYLFERAGEPCITTDAVVATPRYDGRRYGVLYYDAAERPCVVPDDIDAARQSPELMMAKSWTE